MHDLDALHSHFPQTLSVIASTAELDDSLVGDVEISGAIEEAKFAHCIRLSPLHVMQTPYIPLP